jgi:RTX calcium-binding nonapeptide repeat (4 copies)
MGRLTIGGAAALLGAVAVLALGAPGANAARIAVETDGDEFSAGSDVCTVREAVESARRNVAFGGCRKGSKKRRDTIVLIGDAVLTIDGDGPANSAGDLDVTGGGKLTIRGSATPSPDPPAIAQDGSDRVLEVTKQRGVRIQGVDMHGGGDVLVGGAVRAAQGAQVTLSDVHIHDNESASRGGGVACEGCRSLRFVGAFNLLDNSVDAAPGNAGQGGAVWSSAPTVLQGEVGVGGLPFSNALVAGNVADPGFLAQAAGGAIYVRNHLTVGDTLLSGNEVLANGSGGAIAVQGRSGRLTRLLVRDSTLDENTTAGAGGAINLNRDDLSTRLRLTLARSAVTENETSGFPGGNASGGGISVEGNASVIDSIVAGNSISGGANVYGGGIHMTNHPLVGPAPTTTVALRVIRSSVTENTIIGGTSTRNGAGIYAAGTDLEAVNATISANEASGANGYGGGLMLQESINDEGSGRIHFSTIADNDAGLATGGDGIRTDLDPGVRIRASIIEQATNGCQVLGAAIVSFGFNVEPGNDPDCGIDAATDTHSSPILPALTENGSPAVGFGDPPPFGSAVIPRTNAFTNNSSAALDIVPPGQCRVSGEKLATDARGAPRPAEDGCDAGAIERRPCLGFFVAGPASAIGTKGGDQINSSSLSIVFAQAGDDFISTYTGVDRICAGAGNDEIMPGSGAGENDVVSAAGGRDLLNYNNAQAGGITLDLAAGTATGPTIGTDTFTGVENAQASEDDDDLLGSNGANRLIGGGDPDTIRGRGGIDVIDARDGEADVEINCGAGKNSRERALIDPGLDPAPKSC